MNPRIIKKVNFHGPHRLKEDTITALKVLSKHLSIDHTECETHSVLLVRGFDNTTILNATAMYLVSAISQNIEANLAVQEALFDNQTLSRDLKNDVISVVGEHDVDLNFKTTVRNPWMWEAISHMFLHISRFAPDFHPRGKILAKSSIKHDVHDHGLDVIAIYESGGLGISAGECKAYFDKPSRGIRDASNKLREVDSSLRDIEIRSVVNQLRSSLKEEAIAKLAGIFWREERCYLPFVFCDEKHARDWKKNKGSLRKLDVNVSRKILFPLSLSKAREKFDQICNTMRSYTNYKAE
jgi:hypothetical protein